VRTSNLEPDERLSLSINLVPQFIFPQFIYYISWRGEGYVQQKKFKFGHGPNPRDIMKKGLIEAIPDRSRFIYKTTPKGKELQEKLGQFNSMMDHLYSHV